MQVKMILGADAGSMANISWETVTEEMLMQSFFFEHATMQ